MKKLLASLLFLSLFIVSGCGQSAEEPLVQKNTVPEKTQPQAASKEAETMVGNDRDSHGCIGSAGYSWCEAKQKCLRPWEEPCESVKTGDKLPAGYSLDDYRVEKTLNVACQQDSECVTPPQYLVRSNCPYTSLCLKGRCAVVCPSHVGN